MLPGHVTPVIATGLCNGHTFLQNPLAAFAACYSFIASEFVGLAGICTFVYFSFHANAFQQFMHAVCAFGAVESADNTRIATAVREVIFALMQEYYLSKGIR